MILAISLFIYYVLGVLGAAMGYHRFLAHRSFRLRFGLENVLVILGLPAGTPLQWAANHRKHHQFTDIDGDPHSPVMDGFWWAHNGWYLERKNIFYSILYALGGPLRTLFDAFWRPVSNQDSIHLSKDWSQNSVMCFLSRPLVYALFLLLHVTIAGFYFAHFFGLHGFIGWWLTLVTIYNLGDAVDSFGHLYGRKINGQKGNARNNFVLALLTFGDGWHANHHEHPARAWHGQRLFELDIVGIFVSFLTWIGIAYDVRRA